MVVAADSLATAATIVQMALISLLVSRAFLPQQAAAGLAGPAFLLAGAVSARAGLLWLRQALASRVAERVKGGLRDRLFSHAVGLGPVYSSGERAGELVTTATEGLQRTEPYVARYLPQVYFAAIPPALVLVCVLVLDPLSGAMLLATGPAIPVLMVLLGRRAPVLALDEPAADPDTVTERRLLEKVHHRAEGLLLITHRLAGLEKMDEILVLREGRVIERGPHAPLMRRGGAYLEMVETQDRLLAP